MDECEDCGLVFKLVIFEIYNLSKTHTLFALEFNIL